MFYSIQSLLVMFYSTQSLLEGKYSIKLIGQKTFCKILFYSVIIGKNIFFLSIAYGPHSLLQYSVLFSTFWEKIAKSYIYRRQTLSE